MATPWQRTESKTRNCGYSIITRLSLTDANARRVPRCQAYAERPEPGRMSGARFRNEEVEWRDDKTTGHTRVWRNSRNRCGSEPDDGGRSMASSRLSCRPHCRRLGGRGHPWRCARGTKALLQLRVRTRLFRAAMLRPARTLLGRMGLARSPYRGLLLTQRAPATILAKKTWRPADAGLVSGGPTDVS
jgi:hypothetical protein